MSTKVYNAYRVEGMGNKFSNIITHSNSIMEEIRPKIKQLFISEISEYYYNIITEYDMRGTIGNLEHPLWYAMNTENKEKWKYMCQGLHYFSNKNKTYMISYVSYSVWNSVDTDKYNLTDFHYQNSTDKPDNVSSRAWKRRYDTWKKIMDNFNNSPNCAGVGMDVFSLYDIPHITMDVLLENQPSFEDRLSYAAHLDNYKISMENLLKASNIVDEDAKREYIMSHLYTIDMEARKLPKDLDKYRGILPEVYTEDLIKKHIEG